MKNTGERTIPDQFNLYEFERIYRLVSDLYGNKSKIGVALDYGLRQWIWLLASKCEI